MKLKPYPKYKESGVQWIGEVPEGWEDYKIRYLGIFQNGNGFPEELQGNGVGDIPFLKVSDINEPNVIYLDSGINYVTIKQIAENKWSIIPENSILFPKIGEAINKNHRKINKINVIIDNNMSAFVKYNKFQYKYIYYIFKELNMNDFLNISAVPSINMDLLKSHRFPITENSNEQEKITDFLDSKTSEISKTIEADKKLIDLLKEKRTALINHVVTKGLNPKARMKNSGIEWIGKVPEGWEVKKIKFFTTEKRNKATDTDNSGQFIGLENIESMTGKIISYNSIENLEGDSLKFKKDNVLFCKLRPYLAKVIVSETDGFCTSELIIYECDKNTNPSFLKYRLLSKAYIDYVNSLTEGVKMPRADPILLSNIKLPFPPKPEQLQISQYLDKSTSKIDQTVKKIEEKIELLEEFKKSLIHHVVTGKVDVREAMA